MAATATIMYSTPGVFNPPKSPFMTLPITFKPKDVGLLIGHKGANFIKMTHMCGVDYIWHDKESNKIRIYDWNPPKIDIAIKCLNVLMESIVQRQDDETWAKIIKNTHYTTWADDDEELREL